MDMEELLKEIYYLKSYKGYPYLISCILRVKEDETRLLGVRKGLYGPVAKEQGVKLENLEKNLRTLRDAFESHGGAALLSRRLGTKEELRLYPREMIEGLAECLIYEKGYPFEKTGCPENRIIDNKTDN